ncbi:MAG TPA: M48 family metallopeptidase [Bryobacteraceae bacterium]|nr:M48 family metallopeptidase [Bryobacteraceae bacterium]
MPLQFRFAAVLALLSLGGVLASLGEPNPDVSLSSVREIWADVLRDADQVGYKVTRVPAVEEMRVGAEMHAAMSWGAADPEAERYVTAVGARVLPYVRRHDIQYTFHVIDSPGVNAFALPGGHIYILGGMLGFLQSESELAAILGHEMSHVDLRHCIERYQYRIALRKVGAGDLGMLVDIVHDLVAIGYTQYEELEADAQGERLAVEAGYDPEAAARVFHRLQQAVGEQNPQPARTPIGEVAQSIGQAIGSYFQTHPSSHERELRLSSEVASNRRRLAGRTFYVGVKNYNERVPRTEREYPDEKRSLP